MRMPSAARTPTATQHRTERPSGDRWIRARWSAPTYTSDIFVLAPDVQQNYPGEWGGEDARIADAVDRLGALSAQGVRTIVDPTVIGLGRYIPRIQRVAEQLPDLNIVVSTGCYAYEEVPFSFHHRGPALNEAAGTEVPDPMVDMLVGDIENGIAGTGVNAGLLKCAIDQQGLTPGVDRVMRAVAKAHLRTGTPITVHTHPGAHTGAEVKRVLCDEEGVDSDRSCSGTAVTPPTWATSAKRRKPGSYSGWTGFGINLETTFEAQAETVVEMCRRGYADRMVLSQDASCYRDSFAVRRASGLC
ncbi:phosphotriesterase family protein [Streptomyces sp. NPDC055092]